MNIMDTRTYNHSEFWKHQGKSAKWLKGYMARFERKAEPPVTASEDYKLGYSMAEKDLQREATPPHIKNGLSFGHGFMRDAAD